MPQLNKPRRALRAGTSEPVRVAIVIAPSGGGTDRIPPLGAMNLASYAQQALGDSVRIEVHDFSGHDEGDTGALERVLSMEPDVVGFSIYSSGIRAAAAWAEYIARHRPDAIVVAGGAHVTLTWAEFTKRWGRIFDFTIAGDGDEPFSALLAVLRNGVFSSDDALRIPGLGYLSDGGEIVLNPLGASLAPSRWVSPFRAAVYRHSPPLVFTDRTDRRVRKAVALVTSRSCPLRCTFCAIVAMPGKWRAAPSENVVGWLVEEHRARPFEHVYFMDANFFVDPRRVRALVQMLSHALPGVTWSASSTVEMFLRMEADVPFLIQHGLRLVEMGVESGSARQLRILGKKATVEHNVRAIRLVQRYGLQLGLDFIMFYPQQTIDEIRENLLFLRMVDLTQEETFDHYFNTLELYPGTPLRAHYEEQLGIRFDFDELPRPETLFADPLVANVHRLFVKNFVHRYLGRIQALLGRLNTAVRRLDDTHRVQRARIEVASLRHVPFKVLWALCDAPASETLEDAAPWLREFDDYSAEMGTLTLDAETEVFS
jgi:radical SAM superfamily enzyme YgiQ (UPF0313 family)